MTHPLETPLELRSAQDVADALHHAVLSGRPIAPPSNSVVGFDVDFAYAVQQTNVRRALALGDVLTGHKIGLTSEAMQQQLGVDQPDYGVLLESMQVPNGGLANQVLLQPRIEAEIAFLLGSDLDGHDLTLDDVLRATAAVMPALEIIDSRVADWKISLSDTVADNASSGAYVIGEPVPLPTDLRGVDLSLELNGNEVGHGVGSAALGHPAECVRWLAQTLASRGEVLHAGSVVLSGAVHASVPVAPGATFRATSAALGSVSVSFPSSFR